MAIKKYRSLEKKQMRIGYLFILPLIFGLAVVFVPSIIKTIIFTFNDISIDGSGYSLDFIGIENYQKAFRTDPRFIINLTDALTNLATNIPVVVIFSLFIAVLLNQKFKGRIAARTIFFVPVLLATGVILKIEQTTNLLTSIDTSRAIDIGTGVDMSQMSGIRSVLLSLNFNDTLIGIVAGAADGIYSVVQSSGIQIFVLLAALQEIPASLYEAAKVEGSDGWQLFWKITFPMLSPQLVVCAIYTIVDTFTTPNNVFADYVNSLAFSQNQYGYATALNFIYFLCIGVMIAIFGAVISKFVFYNE